jgi:hypothetical protein
MSALRLAQGRAEQGPASGLFYAQPGQKDASSTVMSSTRNYGLGRATLSMA